MFLGKIINPKFLNQVQIIFKTFSNNLRKYFLGNLLQIEHFGTMFGHQIHP